ncbi:hypothetical protein N752_03870 [Desulforamulus aquiferis]|nr:hypothetical protein N752_03870 [Desulforamulus aquiferis]
MAKAGVSSFKIEGRMKSIHYLATIVKTYRQAIDAYLADAEGFRVKPQWLDEITKVSHREYTTGFLLGDGGKTATVEPGQSSYTRRTSFVGLVLNNEEGQITVEQRTTSRQGKYWRF